MPEMNDGLMSMMGGGEPPEQSASSPISLPEKPRGQIASAKIGVQMAIKQLQQAYVEMGEGKEADTIMSCIEKLARAFGQDESESSKLIPAELVSLLQANGASPEQMAMQSAQSQGAK